jgi:nickel/cobalt transporter (NicO) family protein
MLTVRRWILQGVAAALALAAAVLPAPAHPHVWVTVEATLLYENGAFVGLAQKWSFDELYTAMAVEGLDVNKDGKYDRAELAELAKVNMDGLKEFDYFTHPVLAGQRLKLGEARDFWLEHKGETLSLYFTVPFAAPVLTEAKGLAFSVYDPSFFIAFDLAKTDPVRLGNGAPKDCRLSVGGAQGDKALGDSFSAFGGVVSINKAVSVECGSQAVASVDPAQATPKAPGAPSDKIAVAEPPPAAQKAPPAASDPVPPSAELRPEPAAASGPIGRASMWLMEKQREANAALMDGVRRVRAAPTLDAILWFATISFIYGVLHAAGPGHGKAVISSYVLADGRTVRRGVLLSFMAAGVQALSALALVGILIVTVRSTGSKATEAWLETASWGLVTLIGAWLLYTQLRGALSPAHAHAGHHHHGHNHDHHHDHHGHQHQHHGDACEVCAHLPAPSQLQGDWSWRQALSIAFAVGIRPCTGAILVLVVTIGQGLWWAGVFSTLAMAIGTAITVSLLAASAVGFRELTARLAGKGSSRWSGRVQLAAGLGGATLVMALGVVFFIGSLRAVQPF